MAGFRRFKLGELWGKFPEGRRERNDDFHP